MPPSTSTLKCPCCNNPWAAAAGAYFSELCLDCAPPGLSRDNLDPTVEPRDNFYRYANGGWIAKNPIPAGYPNWNSFLTLHVQSQERCRDLLQGDLGDDAEAQKVARFYASAMDEAAIEAAGVEPLQPALALVEEIIAAKNDAKAFAAKLGQLNAEYGIAALFDIGASPDAKNSSHSIAQVYQGGLGLPDRDYYSDDDKVEQRASYVAHVAKLLGLLNGSEPCHDDAAAIMQLETDLATSHMTKTENRDPHATYNKMTLEDLNALGQGQLDFVAYFEACTGKTVTELGAVNVRNQTALAKAAEIAAKTDAGVLLAYLRWHVAHSCAPYLSKAFVDENFDFFERTLSGTAEIKPRWKRAMAFTESAVGEALGKLYCRRYFDESSKARALEIVEATRQALEDRLKEVDWIQSSSTREQALQKMARFRVKIGYPNKWIDYSTLSFEENEPFLSMVFKGRALAHRRAVDEMNAPTDREKWFMTPQTVNAYYHPSLNEIVFPAAILQPPFFDPAADDAVNFGSMAAVIGHEMTHGFDDKGRKYNHEGILEDWWTAEDATEYERRVEVMVEQANAFEVHGKAVQGRLTSGENIADLGGLRLALRALKAQPGYDSTQKLDGFTPDQRFFLAWAQCWRQNITKERALQLVTLDPHGPNEMRCNCPLSNMAEFHAAFGVGEGDPMYKSKESRVDIW